MEKNKITYQNCTKRSKTIHSQSQLTDQSFSMDKVTNLICNLLQLNLKLFQDLFRYKHAFNSFQADLNTHLTTIANQQQQELRDDDDDDDITEITIANDNKSKKSIELQQTKQKISDMICEKFLQTCSDLGQPGLGDDNYESSVYSILGMLL